MVAVTMIVSPSMAQAGNSGFSFRLGPPSVGTGGSNPLTLPPDISDVEFVYISSGGYETSLGIPGILFGKRAVTNWGGYIGVGGGFVLSAQGVGPGVYSSFGVDFRCGMFCWSMAYTQAIGVAGGHITNPYSLRFGVTVWFK